MSDNQNMGTSASDTPASATSAGTSGGSEVASVGTPAPETATVGSVADLGGDADVSSDHKEHYTLLFCCLAMTMAALCMPIEGGFAGRAQPIDLYAKDSIAGAFVAVFAGYGVLAGWMNIHIRKMIVWPAFFAAADAIYVCTMRLMQMINLAGDTSKFDFRDWIHLVGSGWYVLAIASLLVVKTLFSAVMSGAKKDAARKEAAKAARSKK
ncbi:MAG: hypothetical protein K8T90_00385 [Planctomycetes bacterium]|nr:hypothetical protein [Planctomycetota bacterium]